MRGEELQASDEMAVPALAERPSPGNVKMKSGAGIGQESPMILHARPLLTISFMSIRNEASSDLACPSTFDY